MIENEKERIIESIHLKERAIQKAENKIKSYTELKDQETNPLKKWVESMVITHYKHVIEDTDEEIQKLGVELQITLEVIASKQRDLDMIEQKKHFLLPTTLPDPNLNLEEPTNEQDWVSSLSNAISSFITKTSANLNKASSHVIHHKNDANKKDTPDFKS